MSDNRQLFDVGRIGREYIMSNGSWDDQVPEEMTAPCVRFFKDYLSLWEYILFVPALVRRASKEYDVVRLKYKTYYQLLWQMWLCRAVDGFLVYVSELLALIFNTFPDAMKAHEKTERFNLEVVLKYDTKEDIIKAIAEDIVNTLSYKSMRDINKYLSERFNFALFTTDEHLDRAFLLNEIRNLIVHNRSVVNRIFLEKLPDSKFEEGEVIDLKGESIFYDIEFLGNCVADIDIRASDIFSLERPYTRDDLPGISDFSFLEED